MTTIGVLALQGDFAEHAAVLSRIGAEVREIRLPRDLEELHGIIIPGGESPESIEGGNTYGVDYCLTAASQRYLGIAPFNKFISHSYGI